MTDQELKDLIASLAVKSDRLDAAQAKNEMGFAELRAAQLKTDAQLAKTDAKLDRIAKMVGGIAGSQGDVAEEFFYNSLSQSKQIGNLHFDAVLPKVYGGKIGAQQEYDLVLLNGQCAAIVEVKYKLHSAALEQVAQQLSLFRQHFPEHSAVKLYGGVAGFSVPQEVIDEAHQKGLFVLKRQGESYAVDAQQMKAY
jgi:hypothetical protein